MAFDLLSYIIPPAGLTSLSNFAPVQAVGPAHPPSIIADDINATTGELNSIFRGIHPVDGAVITAMRTERASGASVGEVGNEYFKIKKLGPDTDSKLRDATTRALSLLTSRKDIQIITLETETDDADARGAVFVQYRNQHTGKAETIKKVV